MAELPVERLERELRALLPAALAVAEQRGEPRAMRADRLIRVVLACVRPLLDEPEDPRTGRSASDA